MSDPERRATLEAAERLEESMTSLTVEMRHLREYGRRNRHYIWGLTISIVLDIALSIVVAFVAVQASNASSLANQNRQSQITTCEAGNQARAVTVQLWTYVLDLSAQQPENQSPDKRAKVEQFRTYMRNSYAPRDCTGR